MSLDEFTNEERGEYEQTRIPLRHKEWSRVARETQEFARGLWRELDHERTRTN